LDFLPGFLPSIFDQRSDRTKVEKEVNIQDNLPDVPPKYSKGTMTNSTPPIEKSRAEAGEEWMTRIGTPQDRKPNISKQDTQIKVSTDELFVGSFSYISRFP